MAVPKRKTSRSRRGHRRSHDALKPVNIMFDQTTGEPKLAHHVSLDGYYNEREVIVKKEERAEE
jgi:large subunit ribosomal protein L32